MVIPLNFPGGAAASPTVSIQDGTIALGSGETSGTATITSVDTSVSLIYYSGVSSASAGSAELDHVLTRVVLTDGTTVTANRAVALAAITTVGFTVVEYDSSIINSIQAGTITLSGATSGTDTITSVDLSKSFVVFGGNEATSTSEVGRAFVRLTLTNATTVTANKGQSNGSATVNYVVIEFK